MKLLPEKLLIMEFMKRQLNKFHDKKDLIYINIRYKIQ